MVAPTSGPFRVLEDYSEFYRLRDRYKQTKPYTLPLPYVFITGTKGSQNGFSGTKPSGHSNELRNLANNCSAMNAARIQAYEKLKSLINDRASMGENVLEFRKSLSTIENRAMQLWEFTRAVRRGHLGRAATILRTPMPKHKHALKDVGGNWLEFHLGIQPVFQDIYTAVDILQKPIANSHVKARGYGTPGLLSEYKSAANYSVGLQQWRIDQVRVQYQADVAISNPNLYLANALGVVNPAVVAWQMIPLSFVVDWFVNVEQFLGEASDLLGLTVLNASTTSSWRGSYYERWNTYSWYLNVTANGMDRTLGFTTPSLGLRPYKATSWQRGLTAVSLLLGSLKSLDAPWPSRGPKRQLKFISFEKTKQSVLAPAYDWKRERQSRGS